MGNESSTHEEEYPEDRFDGIDTLGYRVLGVQPNSPASSAGLVSFFDFLVGCNGRMLLGRSIDEDGNEICEDDEDYDDVDFPALLRESIGTELDMRECPCPCLPATLCFRLFRTPIQRANMALLLLDPSSL